MTATDNDFLNQLLICILPNQATNKKLVAWFIKCQKRGKIQLKMFRFILTKSQLYMNIIFFHRGLKKSGKYSYSCNQRMVSCFLKNNSRQFIVYQKSWQLIRQLTNCCICFLSGFLSSSLCTYSEFLDKSDEFTPEWMKKKTHSRISFTLSHCSLYCYLSFDSALKHVKTMKQQEMKH